MDNPVYFIDPDGMLSESFINKIKNSNSGTIWTNNDNGTFSNNSGETVDNDENQNNINENTNTGSSQDPPVKKKVLEAKTSLLGKVWFTLEKREWTDPETGLVYQVNADGTVFMLRPVGGLGALGLVGGAGEIKLLSLVKNDSKLFKLAQETFFGNKSLSKEANALIQQLSKGNLNPGIGTKNIARNVFEARSTGGARVYFRQVGEKIEILAYSNKANQQAVIDRILKIF